MDSKAVSARLNLTAKNLRRYLRRNPDLLAGLAQEFDESGRRRYIFTEEDFEAIRESIHKVDEANREERLELTLDPPMPMSSLAIFQDPRARIMARNKYDDRRTRLLERLRATQTP